MNHSGCSLLLKWVLMLSIALPEQDPLNPKGDALMSPRSVQGHTFGLTFRDG